MKKLLAVLSMLVFVCSCSSQTTKNTGPSMSVDELDGGTVVTELGYGIKVNDGSSLQRKWYVLNDPQSPVEILKAGITTSYKTSQYSGEYKYLAQGTATAKEPVAALEIRYLLFNVFGDHMQTLSATVVSDISGEYSLAKSGTWRAWSENDVSEFLTAVSFVASVRTPDGRVWRYDPAKVLRQVEQIKVKLTEKELAPEQEKPKS